VCAYRTDEGRIMIRMGLRTLAAMILLGPAAGAAQALAQDLPIEDVAGVSAPADGAPAVDQSAAVPAPDSARLASILAPVALYPDQLLANIFTAATYPLEVVDADRWLTQPGNAELTGDALVAALQQKDWDPSVKSLVPFPPILKMMDSQLDWTQQIGDAFLSEQDQVMDTVQMLRRQASVTGGLTSGAQQTVTSDGSLVEIQPSDPQSVSVPAYDPSVYGDWPYPQSPPMPLGAYSPDDFGGYDNGWYYGPPIIIYSPIFFWGHFDWRHHFIDRDRGRIATLDPRHAGTGGDHWEHDPAHRRGVAYNDLQLRQRFQPERLIQRPATAPATGQFGAAGDEPQRLFRPPMAGRLPGQAQSPGQAQWSAPQRFERALPAERPMPERQMPEGQRPASPQAAAPQGMAQGQPQRVAPNGQAPGQQQARPPAGRPPAVAVPRGAPPIRYQMPGYRAPQVMRTGFVAPPARSVQPSGAGSAARAVAPRGSAPVGGGRR
jgi:hypothetical protein